MKLSACFYHYRHLQNCHTVTISTVTPANMFDSLLELIQVSVVIGTCSRGEVSKVDFAARGQKILGRYISSIL